MNKVSGERRKNSREPGYIGERGRKENPKTSFGVVTGNIQDHKTMKMLLANLQDRYNIIILCVVLFDAGMVEITSPLHPLNGNALNFLSHPCCCPRRRRAWRLARSWHLQFPPKATKLAGSRSPVAG